MYFLTAPYSTVSGSLYSLHGSQVLDTPVEILHVDENLVVVNKPPSIPVHPIGRFRVNISFSIATEVPVHDVHVYACLFSSFLQIHLEKFRGDDSKRGTS